MSERTCGTCVYWDRTRSVLIDTDEPACVRHEEDALKAKNERLREALRRFAELAEYYDSYEDDDIVEDDIEVLHLRRAKAALEGKP
jgi:hypothetical protein